MVVWGIVAFAVLQVYEPVMHGLHLPEWTLSFVVVLLGLGFPLTVALAWVFDINASGIERTRPTPGDNGPASTYSRSRRVRLALLLVGLGCAAAMPGLVYFFVWPGVGRRPSEAATAGPAAPGAPSIAVLPFADLSPNHDQDYFSDGIAEEILNALAHVEGLRVPGRSSSFWFKGKNAKLADIGRELGVTHVLEGSVRRDGKRLRVTAEVVNVADGYPLWSETFDRDQADIFAVQDQVAQAVVDALRVKLLPGAGQPASPTRTDNLEAYEQYLLGNQLLSRFTMEDMRRAVSVLEKAVALDPNLAPAWAKLSLAQWWIWTTLDVDTPEEAETKRRAIAAADRAVALAPHLSESYVARSRVRNDIQCDFAGADADDARALSLAPNSPWALMYYCDNQRTRGRLDTSIAACRKAIGLDPLSVGARNFLSYTYLASGDLAQARVLNARVLEISPGSLAAQSVRCQVDFFGGKRAEAQDHCGDLRNGNDRSLWLTLIVQEWGTAVEADQAVAALVKRLGNSDPISVAEAYAWRGDADRAFEWLGRANTRHICFPDLKYDPLLRKVRSDPRYTTLLRNAKLPLD